MDSGAKTVDRRPSSRFRVVAGAVKRTLVVHCENATRSLRHRKNLVIYDDAFPHLLTSFRICEFNRYFQQFDSCFAYTNATSFRSLGDPRPLRPVLREYEATYPQFKKRVCWFDSRRRLSADLLYCVFLQNMHTLLPLAQRDRIPFIFTLYPGGSFRLHDPLFDARLRKICSSPYFKKVIATQKITRDYLLSEGFCTPDQVEFIYGGVFPSDQLAAEDIPRKLYGQQKKTFDICFVAYKYMPGGIDKGYDVFIQIARKLADQSDVRFHVVGPFGPDDHDVSGLEERIRFWGSRTTSFFRKFYREMDLILSPNVPFVLFPGAFDGFPTGACIEAGLAGTGVLATDPLDQNIAFKDREEMVIIPHDADAIAEMILHYRKNYDGLRELCSRGQRAFHKVFDIETQMQPRLRLLSKHMEQPTMVPTPTAAAELADEPQPDAL